MKSNFEWIEDERLKDIKELCIEAEKGISVSPMMCAIACRKLHGNPYTWHFHLLCI